MGGEVSSGQWVTRLVGEGLDEGMKVSVRWRIRRRRIEGRGGKKGWRL